MRVYGQLNLLGIWDRQVCARFAERRSVILRQAV